MIDVLLQIGLAAIGFVSGVVQRNGELRHEERLTAMSKSFKDVEKARKVTNKHIAWTRRIIAIIIVLAIFVVPTVVNIIWGLPTFIGYEESNGWLPAIFSGESNIVWKQLPVGIVLTTYHFSMCSLVLGFYFGKSRS